MAEFWETAKMYKHNEIPQIEENINIFSLKQHGNVFALLHIWLGFAPVKIMLGKESVSKTLLAKCDFLT